MTTDVSTTSEETVKAPETPVEPAPETAEVSTPAQALPESEVPFFHLIDDCFVGLFLPLETIGQITDLQESLYRHLPEEVRNKLNWVPPTWFTIPLLHLGRLPFVLLEVIKDLTRASVRTVTEPVALSVKGITTAHDAEGNPRVISLGFTGERVLQLQQDLAARFAEAGFPLKSTSMPVRCTLARVFSDDVPPFMGAIETFRFTEPSSQLQISRIYAGHRGNGGWKYPPVIIGSYSTDEPCQHCCPGCPSLPELSPHDEDPDALIQEILGQSGLSLEATESLIEREVKSPSLLQQSATLHQHDEIPLVTTSQVQDSLRGESQEWEAVRALAGSEGKSKVLNQLEQQKQRWEERSREQQPVSEGEASPKEPNSPTTQETEPPANPEKE